MGGNLLVFTPLLSKLQTFYLVVQINMKDKVLSENAIKKGKEGGIICIEEYLNTSRTFLSIIL